MGLTATTAHFLSQDPCTTMPKDSESRETKSALRKRRLSPRNHVGKLRSDSFISAPEEESADMETPNQTLMTSLTGATAIELPLPVLTK